MTFIEQDWAKFLHHDLIVIEDAFGQELATSASDMFVLHARFHNFSERICYMNNKRVSLLEPSRFNQFKWKYNIITVKSKGVLNKNFECFQIISVRICTSDKSHLEIIDD